MKAIGKCSKCNETITTDCEGCIDGETHDKCEHCGEEALEDVKWKKTPETESELNELEEKK